MTQQEYLQEIEKVIANGKYKDNWQSLSEHKVPGWYYRDKLGIFIHWGIYSVPGYGNEWYSRNMYDKTNREFEYHKKTYGDQKDFGYKDFIPMFKGENFDAKRWVNLFKKAGAKFVMPVAEHHDGFAMYETEYNRWNAKDMGPCVDVIGELKSACDDQGLTFCASSHRAEHYFFMNPGRGFESDINDETYADFYGPAVYEEPFWPENVFANAENPYSEGASEEWLTDWLVRTCELIDKYQPSILYFDWWIQNHSFKPYLKKLAAYYYNRAEEWGKEVTINYKHEAFAPGVATFDVERGSLADISPVPWQTDTAIGKQSWGYRADNEYKSSRQIICDLVDIVSKNGMLLLNIGPKSDGTFTAEETQVLEDLGTWMDRNSEGIYGTMPWKRFAEGPTQAVGGYFKDNDEKAYTNEDFRFTYKAGNIYAYQMRPNGQDVVIQSFAKQKERDFLIHNVTLLGSGEAVDYERNEEGLIIHMNKKLENDWPLCFKVELE